MLDELKKDKHMKKSQLRFNIQLITLKLNICKFKIGEKIENKLLLAVKVKAKFWNSDDNLRNVKFKIVIPIRHSPAGDVEFIAKSRPLVEPDLASHSIDAIKSKATEGPHSLQD